MKSLESFMTVVRGEYSAIWYLNLLGQKLLIQRFGDWLGMNITAVSNNDSLKIVAVVFIAPLYRDTGKKIGEYITVGDIQIKVVQVFGDDGLLIWAEDLRGRLLTFPVSPYYHDDLMDILYL